VVLAEQTAACQGKAGSGVLGLSSGLWPDWKSFWCGSWKGYLWNGFSWGPNSSLYRARLWACVCFL